MKKILTTLMAISVLLTPCVSFAASENTAASKNEAVQPAEIRNQNIFVPTKDGVQRATYEEALKIDEYNKRPISDLTTSYLLGDYETGKILEGNNIDEVHPMASTSKLVSIFVILDKLKEGKINLDDVITIDAQCAALTGSTFKLKENDRVKVKNLLRAALIISGNDAVTALGNYVAGSKEGFVNMMNKKCQELGLKHAHMVNPTGLTDYSIDDYNKMTTREMFILARALIKEHPEILEYTSQREITKAHKNEKEYNTNPLLGVLPEIDGLKTGYTNAAGRCLIATGVKKGKEDESTKDMRLIGITTGSRDNWQRYSAARRLMENGFKDYNYEKIGSLDEIIDKVKVEGSSRGEVNVGLEKTGYIVASRKDKIEHSIAYNKDLKAPLRAGTVVGDITYYVNGKKAFKTNLILKESAHEKGVLFKFQSICESIFSNIEQIA